MRENVGVYINGMYLQYDKYTNEDGSIRYSVSVAVGRYAYTVYMSAATKEVELHDLVMGEIISLKARPYVNKRNVLNWSDGEICTD